MSDACIVPPGYLAGYHPELLDGLDEFELLALIADGDFWLRDNQQPLHDDWTYCGWLGGRGAGKSFGALHAVQREVESGHAKNVAVVSQDETQALVVAVENLQQLAAPWALPELRKDQLHWPNGAVATVYTPMSPAALRGPSFDLAYASEINFWQAQTALEAWFNLTTATRAGRGRVIWDSSPQGDHEIVRLLLQMHEADPITYAVLRGTMLENPALDRAYIRRESFKLGGPGAQKFEEEVMGRVYTSAQGAVFDRAMLDASRVHTPPARPDVTIVSVDPAITVDVRADETGIVTLCRDPAGRVYALEDQTGRYEPDQICDLILDAHASGAAGVVVEENRARLWLLSTLQANARERGVKVVKLNSDDKIGRWQKNVLYYRGLTARTSKLQRALPAATLVRMRQAGVVGVMPELEKQLVTYAGRSDSPNAYDAFCQGVVELAGLHGSVVPSANRRQQLGELETAARMSAELRSVSQRVRSKSVL